MSTKLETLQEKLARLQAQIAEEQEAERKEQAIATVRDAFSEAIRQAVSDTETATGTSLRQIGLGIWCAFTPGATADATMNVSALGVGADGMPKKLGANGKASTNGHSGGNGHSNGNGVEYDYFLKDGRGPFESTLKALDAMGFTGKRGQYYHRWDRLPKELQAKIVRKPKATAEAAAS